MPAILYFAQGEAKVTLGGQEKAAREGTFVYMQPDLEHAIEASTEVVMLLLMIKNPS
jgi:quercetin dioxygenase-like cupin family protein